MVCSVTDIMIMTIITIHTYHCYIQSYSECSSNNFEIIPFMSSYGPLVEISGGCAKIQPVAFFNLHNYAN